MANENSTTPQPSADRAPADGAGADSRCPECGEHVLRHEWDCKRHIDNRAPTAGDSATPQPIYATGGINDIADELEAEALNYEGDFADTVKGCVEALREIAATPQHSVAEQDERVSAALQEGERRGRAVIDMHLHTMATNEHYREREFNEIVRLDAKDGLHRFVRATPLSSTAATQPEQASGEWISVPTEPGLYWRYDSIHGVGRPPHCVNVVTAPDGVLATVQHGAQLGMGFTGDKFSPLPTDLLWLKIGQPTLPNERNETIAFSCKKRADAGASAWSQTCESNCGDNSSCPAARTRLKAAGCNKVGDTVSTAASEQADTPMTKHEVLSGDDGAWYEVAKEQYDRANPRYRRTVVAASEQQAGADDLREFDDYFCMTLSCDGSESQEQVEACRSAAHDAWIERGRRAALTHRATTATSKDVQTTSKTAADQQDAAQVQAGDDGKPSSPDGYLNDDCDAPMKDGACMDCGFGPCRRAAQAAPATSGGENG